MCGCSWSTRTWGSEPLLLKALLDILFPPLCHCCKAFIPGHAEIHICPDCREKIRTVTSPLCPVCGLPHAREGGIDHLCGTCLTKPRPFERARAAVGFDGPVQDLVHRFKYGKKAHLSRPLGLLASRFPENFRTDAAADLIVPVPLHDRRLRARGFNQSQLLGAVVAKEWGIPLSVDNLRRLRWTEPQTGLAAAERERNVRNAFGVARPEQFDGKRLLLVDDVYTTGSTVTECARALKRAGAREVSVLTVARALS